MSHQLPTTIRASQVGAMLGVSRRMSPLALFHKLRGDLPEVEDNELLKEGRYFEDAIARIAAEKYGFRVDFTKERLTAGPLTGEPDRFWSHEGFVGVLEIKNTMFADVGESGWGDPGTDVVPQDYWLQCQVYGHLFKECRNDTDWPGDDTSEIVKLAARLYSGTHLFEIRIDPDVVRRIISEAREFLARLHENNPPSPRDEADMRMRWLVQKGKPVEATAEIAAHIKNLGELSAQIRSAQKAASDIKTLLLGFAQDADSIVDAQGNTLATLGANRMFDEAAFVAENPELAAMCMQLSKDLVKKNAGQKVYERYMRTPQSALEQTRTIRIKGAKEE